MPRLKQDELPEDPPTDEVRADEPLAPMPEYPSTEAIASSTPVDDGVEVSRFEGPGFIKDEFSDKVWPVPTGTFEDVKLHNSPYDIPKDPNFAYEAHTFNEVADMESQGFVKVTRKEVERDNFNPTVAVTPMDNYYTINGEQVMMKIPKLIHDRRLATLKKMADAAVAATEPPKEVDKEGGKETALERDRQRAFTKEGYRI